MVTLKVTNRINENTVVLSEYEWSLIKQARWHFTKMQELRDKVIHHNPNFNSNNKSWTTAFNAVNDYIWKSDVLPTEVKYD